jgi:hypothetical protein
MSWSDRGAIKQMLNSCTVFVRLNNSAEWGLQIVLSAYNVHAVRIRTNNRASEYRARYCAGCGNQGTVVTVAFPYCHMHNTS